MDWIPFASFWLDLKWKKKLFFGDIWYACSATENELHTVESEDFKPYYFQQDPELSSFEMEHAIEEVFVLRKGLTSLEKEQLENELLREVYIRNNFWKCGYNQNIEGRGHKITSFNVECVIRNYLKLHTQSFHKGKTFQCQNCDNRSVTRTNLRIHRNSKAEENI